MNTFMKRYRINRSWGDGVAEALWCALRGKSFPELLNLDLDDDYIDYNDGWETYRRERHATLVASGVRPPGSHPDDYLDDEDIVTRIYINNKGDK